MNTEDVAVKVRNISKLYRIGTKEEMHENLVQAALDCFISPFKNFKKYRSLYKFNDIKIDQNHEFQDNPEDVIIAVRNVTFDVRRGEVLGIIGKNGAGKSTLLKILSRITSPTMGRIEAKGKISSLLEVGTGFHPELSGRENIYLNGTILGMRKREIDQKFDEIVAFSNIEKFLDTPVKRYSSGMKVRLAFSVAAHLDPEILIIDEVLAVGDAEFQSKCLGRMNQVARGGKTVLFVSHDMRAIANLCDRVLLMENGAIKDSGPPLQVIEKYLTANEITGAAWFASGRKQDDSPMQLSSAMILSTKKEPAEIVKFDEGFNVKVEYEVKEAVKDLTIFIRTADFFDNDIWASQDTDAFAGQPPAIKAPGRYSAICQVPPALMRPGRYKIHIGAMIPGVKIIEQHHNAITFDISDIGYPLSRKRKGIITPILNWEIEHVAHDVETRN